MLTRERWGAAKFVQGQLRVFVCNDYTYTDWTESHQHTVSGTVLYMKHEQFLEVISPVLPKDTTTPHIMAVLKRANILVNVGKLMFFRRATQDEITDSEPNGIIAAAVIPPELSNSSSCLDSAHAVELGPVGSPMDVASQESTPHDPMDDLSQELERLMDDDETS
eukprot:s677_g2.t1